MLIRAFSLPHTARPAASPIFLFPQVSEDEQKAMIAFYHKKQQEAEQLAAENEDAYMHSKWADPKALKSAFTGMGSVAWRPGGK